MQAHLTVARPTGARGRPGASCADTHEEVRAAGRPPSGGPSVPLAAAPVTLRGAGPAPTLTAVPTTYLNGRQYQPREVGRSSGVRRTVDVLTGPFHAVEQADHAEGALRAACGAPVIVASPVWWPPPGAAGQVCAECRRRTREVAPSSAVPGRRR